MAQPCYYYYKLPAPALALFLLVAVTLLLIVAQVGRWGTTSSSGRMRHAEGEAASSSWDRVLEERRRLVRETCRRHGLEGRGTFAVQGGYGLLVDEVNKIAYCENAKVKCESSPHCCCFCHCCGCCIGADPVVAVAIAVVAVVVVCTSSRSCCCCSCCFKVFN